MRAPTPEQPSCPAGLVRPGRWQSGVAAGTDCNYLHAVNPLNEIFWRRRLPAGWLASVPAVGLTAFVIFCLSSVGCRSTGMRPGETGVANLSSDPAASRKPAFANEPRPHRDRSLTNKERVGVAKVTLASHRDDPADEIDVQAADESRTESVSSKTEERLVHDVDPADLKVKRPVENEPERPSFIEILRFADKPRNDDEGDLTDAVADSTVNKAPSLRLKFPAEIPGANAPRISLPATDEDHPQKKYAAIDALFPAPPAPQALPIPSDRTYTLAELEALALEHSPIIAQAAAGITMSQGVAIQQGVYPNPTVGYESDTVGSSFSRDYQGMYVSQLVKTAGKLQLQRAAANMDVMNSQLNYEKTRLEVLRSVRAGYYNVLVSQEANRINKALVSFTNQVYLIMVERLKNGEQAAYELSQLQTLVIQARVNLVQSQNRYISAWKQLATSTGIPELRPANLAGRVDMPVPNLDFDTLLAKAFSVHPDLQASINLESQSRLNLKLQKAIPIPDITVAGALQNDSTTPGYQRSSYNLNVSVPIPLFDRNQGNIRVAQGRLNLASQQFAVVQNLLTNQLADAFERYQTARVQSEYYQTQILPDLARAYRGVYDSHISRSTKVAFGDIIVAQQNLANGVSSYISALLAQWVAMTDIANVLQLQDFDELLTTIPAAPAAANSEPILPSPVEVSQPKPARRLESGGQP